MNIAFFSLPVAFAKDPNWSPDPFDVFEIVESYLIRSSPSPETKKLVCFFFFSSVFGSYFLSDYFWASAVLTLLLVVAVFESSFLGFSEPFVVTLFWCASSSLWSYLAFSNTYLSVVFSTLTNVFVIGLWLTPFRLVFRIIILKNSLLMKSSIQLAHLKNGMFYFTTLS